MALCSGRSERKRTGNKTEREQPQPRGSVRIRRRSVPGCWHSQRAWEWMHLSQIVSKPQRRLGRSDKHNELRLGLDAAAASTHHANGCTPRSWPIAPSLTASCEHIMFGPVSRQTWHRPHSCSQSSHSTWSHCSVPLWWPGRPPVAPLLVAFASHCGFARQSARQQH